MVTSAILFEFAEKVVLQCDIDCLMKVTNLGSILYSLRHSRMKNCTAPGPDMIHAYWLKKLTSLHKRLACQMEKLVTEGDHPSWLTQGRLSL